MESSPGTAGAPIPGLYVAGSDQASVMDEHYPSGGTDIGSAGSRA